MAKKTISTEDYNLKSSTGISNLAQELKSFVQANNLASNIQGKMYVQVEAWQYAGVLLGYSSRVVSCKPEAGGWIAECELIRMDDGQVVGGGLGFCSGAESGKKSYAPYALASMAQTRSVSKAHRNCLAWIVRAAGYEPTPTEEMDTFAKEQEDVLRKEAKEYKQQDVAKSKLNKKPGTPEDGAQHATAEAKEPASVKQKTELLMLLNNKVIQAYEKNKMLTTINDMDTEAIEKVTSYVRTVIDERKSDLPINKKQVDMIEKLVAHEVISPAEEEAIKPVLKSLTEAQASIKISELKHAIYERTTNA